MVYLLTEFLEIDNKDEVRISARLHDIGKEYINPRILNKATKLDEEEFARIKNHSFLGAYDSIKKGCCIEIAINILFYHENYNGTGYFGLKGDNIPIASRIIRIVDVYDALTNDRPYGKGMGVKKAIRIMKDNAGEFDPILFEIFENNIIENTEIMCI